MAARETVTACIITLDEQERLPAALASVAFCDQIVVVDSGSTDRTQAIARAAGARVVENPWPGFARQRNVGIDHATSDWVLEVDADERVSPALQAEIAAFLAPGGGSAAHDIAALPLRHRFLGGTLGPSAKYPLYRHRLFRRGAYRHDESRTVHEGLWPRGRTWPFGGDLEHVLAADWDEALADWRAYVRLEIQQSPGGSPAGLLARPPAKLGWRLVVDGGWRDGWRGLVKIGLDVGVDVAVNWHGLRHRSTRDGGHYGLTAPRAGPVRIVGPVLRYVPNVVDVERMEPVPRAGQPRAVFLADFTYEPNAQRAPLPLENVLPRAWARDPEIRVALAGRRLEAGCQWRRPRGPAPGSRSSPANTASQVTGRRATRPRSSTRCARRGPTRSPPPAARWPSATTPSPRWPGGSPGDRPADRQRRRLGR